MPGLGTEQYDEADDESEDRPVNSSTRVLLARLLREPTSKRRRSSGGHGRDGARESDGNQDGRFIAGMMRLYDSRNLDA